MPPGQGALLSCKERKSSFLLPAKAQNKTAIASGEALLPCLCELPPTLLQTLTLDNDSEMAGFRELERTGLTRLLVQATFALAARQQRERRWPLATVLPMGLSFYKITEELHRKAAEWLNKRPRNWLTDQTPAEVFNLARTAAPASCMHRMGGT